MDCSKLHKAEGEKTQKAFREPPLHLQAAYNDEGN
jgi:hypothetical protein